MGFAKEGAKVEINCNESTPTMLMFGYLLPNETDTNKKGHPETGIPLLSENTNNSILTFS